MNNYSSASLKEYGLNNLSNHNNYIFIKGNISDKKLVENIFKKYNPEIVINLAAQAEIRYSIDNPDTYIEFNIIVFLYTRGM